MKEKNSYTVSDFYPAYKEKIHNPKSIYFLTKKEFTDICKDFNKEMSKKILTEGYIFHMPFGLGKITILKKPMPIERKYLRIDYKKTKEIGKPIYHMNTHSREFYYKWKWLKPERFHSAMKRIYNFTPCRPNKRTLAKLILNREMDYIG